MLEKNKLSLEMVQSKKNSKLCRLLEDAKIEYDFVFVGESPYNRGYVALYHPYGKGLVCKGFDNVERYVKRLIKNKEKNR